MTAHMSIERERIGYVLYYAGVLLVGYLAFLVFAPFLVPLGWAAVLAVCVYPLSIPEDCAELGRSRGAVLTTILVLVLLVVPVWLIVSTIVTEGARPCQPCRMSRRTQPPEMAVNAWRLAPGARAGSGANIELMSRSPQAGQKSLKVPGLGVGRRPRRRGAGRRSADHHPLRAVLLPAGRADSIVRHVRAVMPFRETQRDRVLKEVGDLIFASVIAGLVVASIQGALGGLAFWLLGIRAPVVWGTDHGVLRADPRGGRMGDLAAGGALAARDGRRHQRPRADRRLAPASSGPSTTCCARFC